jgi:RsmE family RNA methyltransferase
LQDWIDSAGRGLAAQPDVLALVASLEDGARPLVDRLREAQRVEEVIVAVGPEGDFTADEYAALRACGFQPVMLGANVLRAETAAAYTLSVIDQVLRPGSSGYRSGVEGAEGGR